MPVDVGGLHPAVGPPIAFVVLALLALFVRWAFAGRGGPTADDDGLLVRVATVSRRDWASALQATLSDAGIRSTVRSPAAHRTEVLVFPADAERARALAASFSGPG
ncbi:hypothetical protein [Blastococcus saxobsidens]|uniref:DUF2007 domain-containing protein n=1 Tax=Blastococcus saxobsidens (strain DD2) TaxID=1146883 RepID=H6RXD2_BLASD|nr:hypothetical protein [Blastococcus saxobsidens]CCG04743.1 conserved protein of unknown function [Blastococcus saxobsidens DD2]